MSKLLIIFEAVLSHVEPEFTSNIFPIIPVTSRCPLFVAHRVAVWLSRPLDRLCVYIFPKINNHLLYHTVRHQFVPQRPSSMLRAVVVRQFFKYCHIHLLKLHTENLSRVDTVCWSNMGLSLTPSQKQNIKKYLTIIYRQKLQNLCFFAVGGNIPFSFGSTNTVSTLYKHTKSLLSY